MSDWNPSLYLHFAAERSRPAVELLARVPLENIEYIAELQDLTESEQQHFLTRYHQTLEEQYPLQENGQILLAFPRLFIVARRTE